MIDADWFGKRCLITYRDSSYGLLYWSFDKGEYLETIEKDLRYLVSLGYPLKASVIDGKQALVSACLHLEIPIQRCLVHIQTRVQTLLTRKPKSQAGQDLLLWSRHINTISNKYEAKILIRWYLRLYLRHNDFFANRTTSYNLKLSKSQWWYTHKYLRQAYQHIYQALPNMFTYLRCDGLPKDNNASEGAYSQLDTKISIHRGLSQKSRENMIAWYYYLRCFYPKSH